MRTLVKLAIVGLIVFGLVKTVPAFWSYVEFRDAVGELAMFPGKRTEGDVAERVMKLADQYDVPLDRERLSVEREDATLSIDATYTAELEVFPSAFYPWEFAVHVQATPAAASPVSRRVPAR